MVLRRSFIFGGLSVVLSPVFARSQSTELVLDVRLPTDRSQTGLLSLKRADGTAIISDFRVLGKADNARASSAGNPQRDPTLPFGDTPTGYYSVPRAVATGSGTKYSSASYGNNGALVLNPTEGEAKQGKQNGRVGLLVHGGNPGTGGRLRATHGCLRLSDGDMARLMEAIRGAGSNPVFNRCEVVTLSVLVGLPSAEEPGADEDDPPPGIIELLKPQGPSQLPRP